jgi:hypothetical protein
MASLCFSPEKSLGWGPAFGGTALQLGASEMKPGVRSEKEVILPRSTFESGLFGSMLPSE